ncbi:sodium:solute symporter family protein [Engelhardtia mirabilis]|uniref:Sodium/proline symporter n=1 Tax=Engelhardtia mirabilis TaxID=2528011 RepID=A0A518BHF7_9BACT|nr:Sodium/proline symporter [Planctomycetes bacterium Pla133]QDV00743.1 Sodium/proline symporter [Planctomycetes bacterium Pla86]
MSPLELGLPVLAAVDRPLVVGLVLYVAVVLAVGLLAARRSGSSPREYFLAGNGLGTAVLFMALFGTNCTAFVLVGVPGQAYHSGLGIFSINAPIIALGIPLTFWAIGAPARRLGRELGALTPAELYSKRLGSRSVGLLLFGVFALYTVPYMVTAVQGAAVTLASSTEGAIPEWLGGAAVLAVALCYTSIGGMRATAWTNVVQGVIFLGFVLAAVFLYARAVGGDGGLAGAMARLVEERPELTTLPEGGLFEPRAFASWSLAIALTVIAFPHMLVRLMAAESERSLRSVCRLYPLALVLLWLPVVLIGTFGALEFPGLVGRDSDRIFATMAGAFLPPWLEALSFVAVLAAVMSTLDAQILTLGSMVTRDVLDPLMPNRREEVDVLRGRLFGGLLALVVFALWRVGGASIYSLASVAFSGYVTLVPTMLFGVRWERFNARGAVLSILVGNGCYFAALFAAGGLDSAMRPSLLGFLPVVWGLVGALLGALVGTYQVPRASTRASSP